MDVVKLTKELVSIDSQPDTPTEGIGNYIYGLLKELGLKPFKQKIKQSNRFNVLVTGTGSLLINGHMDTVPVENSKEWKHSAFGEIVNGKVYGRGSCDTKGNIAALLAEQIKKTSEGINLSCTAINEKDFDAVYEVKKKKKTRLRQVKYGITLEPTGSKIMPMSKGQYTFEVTAKGKSAHASRPWLGKNAIEMLAECVPALQKHAKELRRKKHPYLGSASLNIGLINGGAAPNIVPNYASMIIDRRVLPKEKTADVIKRMKKVCHSLKVKLTQRLEPAESPVDSKIVKLMQSIHKKEGLDQKVYGIQGTTELTAFVQNGMEGIVYGPGDLAMAHTVNEHISISSLKKGKKVFERLLNEI